MIGVEFVQDRNSKEPAEKMRDAIVDQAFRHGLLLLGCGYSTIRFAPPLSVSKAEVDEALEIFEGCITLSEKEVQAVAA